MKKIKEIKIVNQDESTEIANIGADAINVDYDDTTVKAELDKLNTVDNALELKLNKKPYYYNNVAAMKADNSLKAGDMAITLGYYEANDGGGAEYKIRTKTNEDIEDNGAILFIGQNLVVEMIMNDSILVDTFGAKGDGQTDDSNSIGDAINYANKTNKKIVFSNKLYCVSKSFYIKGGISIEGNFAKIIPLSNGNFTQNYIFLLNSKDGLDWFEE